MNKPRGLGKGLGAIFQEKNLAHHNDVPASEVVAPGSRVEVLEISRLQPNPFNPRKEFAPEELEELSSSIREKGVLQPILVRPHGQGFQIIAGERRFRASQLAGKDTIPALVREQVTDREMREIALLENIQRVQLNPLEEAQAFQELITECGYTHEQLSERLGKSRPTISNSLRLLRLHPDVRDLLVHNKISAGHARTLTALPEDRQKSLAHQVVDQNWSVRTLEQVCAVAPEGRTRRVAKPAPGQKDTDPNRQAFLRTLELRLGTRVTFDSVSKEGKGSLRIQFLSKDDLNRIADLLLGHGTV